MNWQKLSSVKPTVIGRLPIYIRREALVTSSFKRESSLSTRYNGDFLLRDCVTLRIPCEDRLRDLKYSSVQIRFADLLREFKERDELTEFLPESVFFTRSSVLLYLIGFRSTDPTLEETDRPRDNLTFPDAPLLI